MMLQLLCLRYQRVSKGIKGYPKVSKGIQRYQRVSKDIKGYPKVSKGIQRYQRVFKDIKGYPKVQVKSPNACISQPETLMDSLLGGRGREALRGGRQGRAAWLGGTDGSGLCCIMTELERGFIAEVVRCLSTTM